MPVGGGGEEVREEYGQVLGGVQQAGHRAVQQNIQYQVTATLSFCC